MRYVLYAAAAALACALPGATAASVTRPSRPVLTPCAGPLAGLGGRCGSIGVALDRVHPAAGRTRIVFALLLRRDKSRPSLGTVVLSSGPIIAAGVEYAQGLAPLRARRDLLFIDQRGTGRSGAVSCRGFDGVVPALGPREQLLERIGACGRQLGSRAGFYGSAAAADDIDAVRAALGFERLDLWGASYGTYVMTIYAARHPTHVRSLVLHGAYPIDFDPWALDRLAAARRSIGLVCARTHACRGPIVLRNLTLLATRLRNHPVSFMVATGGQRAAVPLDEAALARVVYGSGNVAGFGRLPSAVASALAGDLAPLRRLVELTLRPLDASFGQAFAQQCHEYPRVFAYADAIAARRTAYLHARSALSTSALAPFSAQAWTATQLEAGDSCLAWPNDTAAARPFPAATPMPDVPVLALTGDLDTNTPAASGREAAARFRRATFVEIPNVGHTPETSACAVALAIRFVATLKADPTACERTGTPPRVAARAPLAFSQLPLVRGHGTELERRTLAVAVATLDDLQDQTESIGVWGAADALRGGRYIAAPNDAVRLDAVRVVRDATVTGVASLRPTGLTATLTVRAPGAAAAHLRVSLRANGTGHATGSLNGRSIDLEFRR